MKTIIVDDEVLAIKRFEMECEKIPWVELEGTFSNGKEALQYVASHKIEAAFLDIQMPEMDGIVLGKKLREIYPKLVIVFVTGYREYMLDALQMKADYYLMKPYSREALIDVMENARLLTKRQRKKVYIRTFGKFYLQIDGEVVHFANAKAKELLALCVDQCGADVTMEEAIDKLWENRAYDDKVKNLYRKAVMNLRDKFREYDIDDVFIAKRGRCYIDCDEVECDYFDFLEKRKSRDVKSQKEYSNEVSGAYMLEYTWAEETNARIFKGGVKSKRIGSNFIERSVVRLLRI